MKFNNKNILQRKRQLTFLSNLMDKVSERLQLMVSWQSWLTIFTSKELDSVTEVARHAAVEYTNTCRDPGVRP